MMTNEDKIKVIQAHLKGKTIEIKNYGHNTPSWTTISFPRFNFRKCDYRVKKEPNAWLGFDKLKAGEIIEVREVLKDE